MAVKYIKTKITHIRLADPELRLLPIPLPPLTLQVARTHDVAGGGVTGLDCVYLAAVDSVTNSVSLSLSQYKQLALISLSLSADPARPAPRTLLAGCGCRLGSAFLFTF